jgi:putative ABC transport system permease protein
VRALRFALTLAWREARGSTGRLALLAGAVSCGVGALVAIDSFADALQDSVRQQARALLGADLSLSSANPFSAAAEKVLAELIRAGGGGQVSIARVVGFGAMAYAPRGAGARLVQVSAVEPGYPFYGRIETDPPEAWGLLQAADPPGVVVDPSLLAILEAGPGDTLSIGEARFTIRGTIVNVPGDVGIRSAFGPRVFIAARDVGRTGLLGFGSRARYEAYLRLPADASADRLADRFRPPLAAERVNLRTVSEDQRNLNSALGRLARYLGLMAFVALLLGGLGVASAVHAFIQRRTETIAVLRCLGATPRRVLAAYLLQSAAMAVVGGLVGGAAGTAVQLLLPRVLAGLLPVDVEFAPSPRSIVYGLALGLLVSTAFALPALLAVRDVSPVAVFRKAYEPPVRRRDRWWIGVRLGVALALVALSVLEAGAVRPGLAFAAGIAAALAALWLAAAALVRLLRRSIPRGLAYVWRQGLANLHRPANQTVAVVLALGFGTFVLATVFVVQDNLLRGLRVTGSGERPNLALFDIQPDQRDGILAAIRGEGLHAAPAVPIVPMRILSVKGRAASTILASASVFAAGPREERTGARSGPSPWTVRREYRSTYRDALAPTERIVAGRPWAEGEWRNAATSAGRAVPISMEAEVARELGVGVGDEIVWDVQGVALATRVATLREVEWVRFEPNFFVVFPEGPLDQAPQTFVTLTRMDDPERRGRFQRRMVERFPNVTVLDLSQVQRAIEDIVSRVSLAIRFMALFTLGAGAAILVGSVAASRHQRMRETAVLKALGARRSQVMRIVFAEYASLGALAAAAGVSLAVAAAWALLRWRFESSLAVPVPALLSLAAAVVALTVAVGLWSSVEVFRKTALEVLRAE